MNQIRRRVAGLTMLAMLAGLTGCAGSNHPALPSASSADAASVPDSGTNWVVKDIHVQLKHAPSTSWGTVFQFFVPLNSTLTASNANVTTQLQSNHREFLATIRSAAVGDSVVTVRTPTGSELRVHVYVYR